MSLFTDLREVFTAYAQQIKEKADKATTYTKTEVDSLISEVEVETDTKIDTKIDAKIGDTGWQKIVFTPDSFIDLSKTTVDVSQMTTPAYGFSCAVVPCSAGDKFLLNLTGGGRSRAWGFVSSNGNVISVADGNTTVSDYTLIAPANSAYLVLHDNSGSESYIKGKTVVEMIESRAGLSVEAKEALIACFDNAAWKGTDGSSYVNALRSALDLVVWDYNWNATSKLNPPDMTAYSFNFNDEAGAVKVNQPNLTLTHSGEFDFEIVCRFVVLPGSGQPFFAIAYATKNGSKSLQIRPNASLDDDNLKDKISYTLNWDANTKQFTSYTQTVYRKYRIVVESGSLKFYIDNKLILQRSYDKSEPTGTNTIRIVSAEHPYNIYNMHIKSIKFRDIVSN